MMLEEAKQLLPHELIYPLPDGVIDNLIDVSTIPIKFNDNEEDNKGMYYALLAALIELKERRRANDGRD